MDYFIRNSETYTFQKYNLNRFHFNTSEQKSLLISLKMITYQCINNFNMFLLILLLSLHHKLYNKLIRQKIQG